MKLHVRILLWALAPIAVAGTAAAQPAIDAAVNAGSRISTGLPNYGVEQEARARPNGQG